jgi:hypothetical protein
MPATNSVNRCLPPYVFFASTPLSRVLEELIISQLFEIFPKTLCNTRVHTIQHILQSLTPDDNQDDDTEMQKNTRALA